MSTPCTWRGNPYPSEAAVARAARKSPAQVSQHLDANGSLDSFEAAPVSIPSVRHLLALGYGVYDIANKLNAGPDDVRAAVQHMRSRGVLRRMWPKSGG